MVLAFTLLVDEGQNCQQHYQNANIFINFWIYFTIYSFKIIRTTDEFNENTQNTSFIGNKTHNDKKCLSVDEMDDRRKAVMDYYFLDCVNVYNVSVKNVDTDWKNRTPLG